MMGRYKIDERVACLAVRDTVVPDPSNGCHPEDENVIAFWSWPRKDTQAHEPQFPHEVEYFKKCARTLVEKLNRNEELESENERLKRLGDNHAETLRGIAAMDPETEGDRMKQ